MTKIYIKILQTNSGGNTDYKNKTHSRYYMQLRFKPKDFYRKRKHGKRPKFRHRKSFIELVRFYIMNRNGSMERHRATGGDPQAASVIGSFCYNQRSGPMFDCDHEKQLMRDKHE